MLQTPDGFIIEYSIKIDFLTTNNEAECETLMVGLGLARTLRVAYESEAVVPLKITHTSPRDQQFEPEANKDGIRLALYMICEVRDQANMKLVESQKRASYYYNI